MVTTDLCSQKLTQLKYTSIIELIKIYIYTIEYYTAIKIVWTIITYILRTQKKFTMLYKLFYLTLKLGKTQLWLLRGQKSGYL